MADVVRATPVSQPVRLILPIEWTYALQAEAVSRVDEQLRAEMIEAQSQLARWITEQKQVADSVALQAQNTLDNDKGACPPLPHPSLDLTASVSPSPSPPSQGSTLHAH